MISTLKYKQEKIGRMVGNSTRQANFAIEKIIQGETVICEDHYEDGKHKKLNRHLFDKILRRLVLEHSGIVIEKDFKELTIKRVN